MSTPINPESQSGAEAILPKDAWHQVVEREVGAATLTGQPVAVLLVDVDEFKGVNDTISHDRGDEVLDHLRGMFANLKSTLHDRERTDQSPDDIVLGVGQAREARVDSREEMWQLWPANVGGDEFAVLCHTDENGIDTIARTLRDMFNQYLALPENEDLQQLGVNLAIGTANFLPGMTKSELLRLADDRMKTDKISRVELTPETIQALRGVQFILEQAGVRPRSLPKLLSALDLYDQQRHS